MTLEELNKFLAFCRQRDINMYYDYEGENASGYWYVGYTLVTPDDIEELWTEFQKGLSSYDTTELHQQFQSRPQTTRKLI